MSSLFTILLSISSSPNEKLGYASNVKVSAPLTALGNKSLPTDFSTNSCYYLDYSGDVTLTLAGVIYKNPVFYCPTSSSSIYFKGNTSEIKSTEIFSLSSDLSIIRSLYFATKDFTTKTPKKKIRKIGTLSINLYRDVIVFPVDGGTLTISGMYYLSSSYSVIEGLIKDQYEYQGSVGSSRGYVKRQIAKRYSVKLPTSAPYALANSGNFSVGAIIGVAVGAALALILVVIVYRSYLKRKNAQSEESETIDTQTEEPERINVQSEEPKGINVQSEEPKVDL